MKPRPDHVPYRHKHRPGSRKTTRFARAARARAAEAKAPPKPVFPKTGGTPPIKLHGVWVAPMQILLRSIFEARDLFGDHYVVVDAQVRSRDDGSPLLISTHAQMKPGEDWASAIRRTMRLLAEHEIDECIRSMETGRLVFDPHPEDSSTGNR